MADEKEINTETVENNIEQSYADTITQMKETMVSREEYNRSQADNARLLADNQKLAKALLEGEKLEREANKPQETDDDLRKILSMRNVPNVERARASLELRNRTLAATGEDDYLPPFLDKSKITAQDREEAQKFADIMEHCLTVADGNNNIFMRELDNCMSDPIIPSRVASNKNKIKF